MSISKKTIILISVVAAGVVGIPIIALFVHGDPCEVTTKQQQRSPDGIYIARVKSRDCGALATGQTYVEIRKGLSFASPKEVLEILHPDQDKEVRLSWASPTMLQIYYEGYLSEIQYIAYNLNDLKIETFAREKVLTENYIRQAGHDGGYLKLVDYDGRPSPLPVATTTERAASDESTVTPSSVRHSALE